MCALKNSEYDSIYLQCYGVLINYLEKGKRINGEYYASLLQRSNDEIKNSSSHFGEKESVDSSRQRTSSHVRYRDCFLTHSIRQICPLGLCSLSEKMARW